MQTLIKISKEDERIPKNVTYMTYRTRLRSFKDWPCSLPLQKAKVAEAGFYYTKKGQKMMCYFCGGVINYPVEDPWLEHARLDSNCQLVEIQKGTEYVEAVKNNKPIENKPKNNIRKQRSLKGNCALCENNQKDASYFPCGHLLNCMQCSEPLETCPFCNVPIKYKIKTYI